MSTKIDETDKEILNILQDDARTSFRIVAQKLGVSESTVYMRVKKMEKNGVITGYRTVIDSRKVGKNLLAFVLVRAKPTLYIEVLDALKEIDEIYEVYDVTGTYYAVLKVRTKDPVELASILDKIGTLEGVDSTETAVVLRIKKENLKIKL